jgi:hypothetical protein
MAAKRPTGSTAGGEDMILRVLISGPLPEIRAGGANCNGLTLGQSLELGEGHEH